MKTFRFVWFSSEQYLKVIGSGQAFGEFKAKILKEGFGFFFLRFVVSIHNFLNMNPIRKCQYLENTILTTFEFWMKKKELEI